MTTYRIIDQTNNPYGKKELEIIICEKDTRDEAEIIRKKFENEKDGNYAEIQYIN